MSLHVSVILFTGGAIPACIAGGIPAYLAAGIQGGAIPAYIAGGIPAYIAGGIPVCLAAGLGGGGGSAPGGCLVETPLPGTTSAAGGTHPTGMHSCLQRAMTNSETP